MVKLLAFVHAKMPQQEYLSFVNVASYSLTTRHIPLKLIKTKELIKNRSVHPY